MIPPLGGHQNRQSAEPAVRLTQGPGHGVPDTVGNGICPLLAIRRIRPRTSRGVLEWKRRLNGFVDLDARMSSGYAQNGWIRGPYELDCCRILLTAVYEALAANGLTKVPR
jgi:hypothetical protein